MDGYFSRSFSSFRVFLIFFFDGLSFRVTTSEIKGQQCVHWCKMSLWIKFKALIKLHTNTQQIHAAQCVRASRTDPILSDTWSDLTASFTMRQTSYLCLSHRKEIKTLHAVQKFQLHHQGDIYLLSRFSLSSPHHLIYLFFPKQHVSDTCNIQVSGVSGGNQRQDLSLLTLSVACPLFLWSFYYRAIISFISAAQHTVHF